MKKLSILTVPLLFGGCAEAPVQRVVPAVEYTRAVHSGNQQDFSIFDIAFKERGQGSHQNDPAQPVPVAAPDARAQLMPAGMETKTLQQLQGDPRYLQQGFQLKNTIKLPETESSLQLASEASAQRFPAPGAPLPPGVAGIPPSPPPGSSSPYHLGQMTSNPSLWPDESQQNSLFRDLRAFQPMDVVTIVINESVEGQKKTQTDSQSRFSLLAAVENLFNFLGAGTGAEAAKWVATNPGIDPENLINATTNSVYQGLGQTKRLGSLRGKMSAIVLEVLPNGLLRIEGTKIISVDNEEEVMVVSGLARLKDVDSGNQIDSSRIANMRIDFYGRGVAGDVTDVGWGTRLVRKLWPF